jgi:hypothetical protein
MIHDKVSQANQIFPSGDGDVTNVVIHEGSPGRDEVKVEKSPETDSKSHKPN